jgi:hypothetical protein
MKTSTGKAISRFCLVANGSSDAWQVSIDESVRGAEKWYVDIEGPSVYLSFQLVDRDIIDKMIAFLDENMPVGGRSRNGRADKSPTELVIGKFGQAPVSLLGDDEYADRCFLVIGPNSNCCMRIPLVGEDTRMILDALRQVREDLP